MKSFQTAESPQYIFCTSCPLRCTCPSPLLHSELPKDSVYLGSISSSWSYRGMDSLGKSWEYYRDLKLRETEKLIRWGEVGHQNRTQHSSESVPREVPWTEAVGRRRGKGTDQSDEREKGAGKVYQTWMESGIWETWSYPFSNNSRGHLTHSDTACASTFLSGEGKRASA